MSLSNPTIKTPAKKFIEWNGDKGRLSFYDKEIEQKIEIPLPVYFVVLDELSTITGFSKLHKCGIYSNEVHRITDEILKVKTFKGGESITGKYADIKNDIKAIGGKFTKSIYAAIVEKDKPFEIVCFKLHGCAFSQWIEHGINTETFIIGITDKKEDVNGNTTYFKPVFKSFKMSEIIKQTCISLDGKLQEYLKYYKNQAIDKEEAKEETDELPAGEIHDKAISDGLQKVSEKSTQTSNEFDDLPF